MTKNYIDFYSLPSGISLIQSTLGDRDHFELIEFLIDLFVCYLKTYIMNGTWEYVQVNCEFSDSELIRLGSVASLFLPEKRVRRILTKPSLT